MNIPADNDTILLVDDEPGICTVLSISLTDIGYTVHTANDGDEALRIFHQQQPSIVCLVHLNFGSESMICVFDKCGKGRSHHWPVEPASLRKSWIVF